MVTEESFQIPKTARYVTLGDPVTANKLLLVLHGYGQLSRYFIRKFDQLVSEGYFIVAPEGMHRFYLEGTSGRVGASWMTKERRMDDIHDNVRYLDLLASNFESQFNFQQKVLLGFSQGGATAARWESLGTTDFDCCVLWGSIMPEDIEVSPMKSAPSNYHFVVGDQDPYFQGSYSVEKAIKEQQELGLKTHVFEGKHDIDGLFLKTLLAKYL